MRLPFNADRVLTHLVADLAVRTERAAPEPNRRPPPSPADDDPEPHRLASRIEWSEQDRARLVAGARTVVVGEPTELDTTLTWDSTGWSPNGTYGSRQAAISLASRAHSWLHVDAFDVVTLWWSCPDVFVEWVLVARQTQPLLIGDDIVIDPTGCRIDLSGAAALRFEGEQISRAHVYWDDATLIEQVLAIR